MNYQRMQHLVPSEAHVITIAGEKTARRFADYTRQPSIPKGCRIRTLESARPLVVPVRTYPSLSTLPKSRNLSVSVASSSSLQQ